MNKNINKDMNKKEVVVIVNKADKKLGMLEKIKAHLGKGVLHRGFVVFIFNNYGDLLLQKRSKRKMLWPLFWDGACASHPREKESYLKAARRRLKEELGFSCLLKLVDKFQYTAKYKKVGSENEVCAVLIGNYSGEIKPNPDEIADWQWMSIEDFCQSLRKNPRKYTPWLKITFNRLKQKNLWPFQRLR